MAALFAAVLASTTVTAAEESARDATAETQPSTRKSFPFRGKIAEIDKEAKTVTLAGKERKRVIQITDQTKMIKNGLAAKLEDAVVGEEAGGLVVRLPDGKEQAVSIRFGAKPEAAKGKAKSGAES